MAKITEPAAPALPEVFELDEAEAVKIRRKGGKTVIPSLFDAQVKASVGAPSDKVFALPTTAEMDGKRIVAELRKAAKQNDLKLRIWDRSDAEKYPGEKHYVAFKHIPAVADDHHDEHHTEAPSA